MRVAISVYVIGAVALLVLGWRSQSQRWPHVAATLALWIALGIVTLRIMAETSLWLTAAAAAFFFGKALFLTFQLVGTLLGQSAGVPLIRGTRVMGVGYVVAGCIIGLGALWQRTWLGFFVAYGAFSFAWLWLWLVGHLPKGDLHAGSAPPANH